VFVKGFFEKNKKIGSEQSGRRLAIAHAGVFSRNARFYFIRFR
jgi:hypothetical protein